MLVEQKQRLHYHARRWQGQEMPPHCIVVMSDGEKLLLLGDIKSGAGYIGFARLGDWILESVEKAPFQNYHAVSDHVLREVYHECF